ncbi:hypothetical protein, partial [Escherichia coli]|uniref:hypothetical protein n=1 Tax=Escherichia coli TaxID=562 RepID=UPI001BFCFB4C
VGLPTQADTPVRFWSQMGLPFLYKVSVDRFGVRLFQPNWPFFPPDAGDTSASGPSTANLIGPDGIPKGAAPLAMTGSLI